MKKHPSIYVTPLLSSFVLIGLSVFCGIRVSRADQADRPVAARPPAAVIDGAARFKSRKLSPEMERVAMQPTALANRVRTIVQVSDPQSQNLKQLLRRFGVRVHKQMNRLQMIDAELPADALRELAESNDIQFISANQPVAALGHLTTTTGADAVRRQINANGQRYTLDGSGIGIAILDSGLDITHKAFKDDHRVLANVDFTGERRTD